MILVIDDNTMSQNLIKTMLEMHGIKCLQAYNGKEALESACAHRDEIELLLIDFHLPDTNGIDLLQEIRRCGIKAPAIGFTASTDPGTYNRFVDNGFADVIYKPFHIVDFMETVSRFGIVKTDTKKMSGQ